MIARLRGHPAGRSADGLVLDVHGVGYLVAATPGVMRRATAGAEITVETYLHVREDALQLYGFADADERELFVHLLTVSGIGKKTAERIVLELKEKVGSDSAQALSTAGETPGHLVARDALVELGYSVLDAERALADVDSDLPAEERVRLALRGAAA